MSVDGTPSFDNLAARVDEVAIANAFSGVVRVDRAGACEFARAYGLADRAYGVANTIETRFGIASGTKGFTALAVMSLIVDGALSLSTSARSVLGGDLPEIGDTVTVEHLLAHRSGIGDYLDEDEELDLDAYLLAVPAHELVTSDDYLAVLGGHPTKFAPGSSFSYCNSGYVVLALIAERVSGVAFADLVRDRVCRPAGLHTTGFIRSDELPGDVARGYLSSDSLRSNVFHLPALGSGDGGLFSSVNDCSRFWPALFGGAIVPEARVRQMTEGHSDLPAEGKRYGLGFWLGQDDTVWLEGMDAGVSFRSAHHRASALTHTVIANTTNGAWPMCRLLDDVLPDISRAG